MLNKYYPPHLGGIEFHMRDLAEALVARPDTHVRAIVANEGGPRVDETLNGVEVVRLPRRADAASTPVAPSMRAAIRDEAAAPPDRRPDVFHLHFPYPWGEVSWLAAGGGGYTQGSTASATAKVPSVVTYHSDIVRQKAGLAAYRPLLERFLDRIDLIIASSPDMVEHSEFLNPRAEKCRVVPFGINIDQFAATPAVQARAAELRQGHTRPIVLFVGRLIYYKGADVLVKAMSDIDADLVIIGTGPLESELRTIAAASGILDRVTFLRSQPFDELVAWYHAADLFCLPSVARSEAFGLVQLEAHAAGTPVISTTLTTGVPFVNQDGVTGLTVPPGDADVLSAALRTLVNDREVRERYGRQAYERVHRDFTIDRMVDDTLAVYAEAAERRGGRGARS